MLNVISQLKPKQHYTYYGFGSKNYPIVPFTINTKFGPLFVQEILKKDINKSAKFSYECGIQAFPTWYDIEHKNRNERNFIFKTFKKSHKRILSKKDGNSTILVAKDSNNDIKALVTMQYFDEFAKNKNGFRDLKTGYIEECMIDAKYKGQGVGKILLNKIIESVKDKFTDVFLEADNSVVAFYKKLGFLTLDTTKPFLKRVNDLILKYRPDAEFITPMSKSFDPSNTWWKRMTG